MVLETGAQLFPPMPNSRHDAGEVEELSREIRHVAVEEDEEGLDDSDVGGEAGCEGSDHPINDAHKDTAQRYHEEAEEAKDDIENGHLLEGGKLLKEMIEDLGGRRQFRLLGQTCLGQLCSPPQPQERLRSRFEPMSSSCIPATMSGQIQAGQHLTMPGEKSHHLPCSVQKRAQTLNSAL